MTGLKDVRIAGGLRNKDKLYGLNLKIPMCARSRLSGHEGYVNANDCEDSSPSHERVRMRSIPIRQKRKRGVIGPCERTGK